MARYPDSKALRVGKSLLRVRNKFSSEEIEDLELLTVVSGSQKFASEFCQRFGGAAGLRQVRSPHELLQLPSATDAIVGKVYSTYEIAARIISAIRDEQSMPDDELVNSS